MLLFFVGGFFVLWAKVCFSTIEYRKIMLDLVEIDEQVPF